MRKCCFEARRIFSSYEKLISNRFSWFTYSNAVCITEEKGVNITFEVIVRQDNDTFVAPRRYQFHDGIVLELYSRYQISVFYTQLWNGNIFSLLHWFLLPFTYARKNWTTLNLYLFSKFSTNSCTTLTSWSAYKIKASYCCFFTLPGFRSKSSVEK